MLNGDVGVVTQNFHAEGNTGIGNLNADGAQTDNTQHLAGEFGADKLALAAFNLFFYAGIAFLEGLAPFDAFGNPAGSQQHAGQHQFLYGIGICAGRIEYGNALLCEIIQRNIVYACACACNANEVFIDFIGMHIGAAHHDAIRVFHIGGNGIQFFLQDALIYGRDAIEGFDIVRHFICAPFQTSS